MTRVLAIDMGTTVAKAGLWDDDALVAVGRTRLSLVHPGGGRVEQDADTWWPAAAAACRRLDDHAGAGASAGADAVVLCGARQTLVPVTAEGSPVGPALVWSDRRATDEGRVLADACGGRDALRRRTGTVLDAFAPPAKVAWLARHEPERLAQASWLLSPRELVAWHLSGVVATDATAASASGFYDAEGVAVAELVAAAGARLPPPARPDAVLGVVTDDAARATGLRAGIPVVNGAGDRACEVLGAGAGEHRPMAAWGTTANVSMPLGHEPSGPRPGLVTTRALPDGWLVEGGVAAAGSLLEWLAGLTGHPVEALLHGARGTPPGAAGLAVLPWLGGARAPWWRDDVAGALVGLRFEHGPADLARAVLEAVAVELARCVESMAAMAGAPEGLVVGGSSATDPLWLEVLSAVTGLGWRRRRSGEAALAGAALVASLALGLDWDLERLDPVAAEGAPDPTLVEVYGALRQRADVVAQTVLGLHDGAVGDEVAPCR